MPAGRPSFSSRSAALFAVTTVLGLSGCTGNAPLLPAASESQSLRLTTINEQPVVTAASAEPQPGLKPVSETPATQDIVAAATVQKSVQKKSAWCDYLEADAAADATVLRSPTFGGQLDDEGQGSVSLSLSMAGFRKATLIEESAEARCRRHLAESGLQKVIFLAPQDLSSAGFRSKAQAISRHAAELERLRKRIRAEVNAGNIAADKAANLSAVIDGLYSAAAEARSQAERRERSDGALTGPAAEYSAELLRAEEDLQDITSRLRTADAFDVSVEAGYSDGGVDDGFDSMQQGVSGKVKFTMKLGAFAPQRYELERRARDARIAAVRDQEGGALWQIKALREAHLKAISGLEESQRGLERALAETRKFMRVVETTPDPEFGGTAIETRLRMIQLEADHAAVSGSLVEIRGKLRQLAPG